MICMVVGCRYTPWLMSSLAMAAAGLSVLRHNGAGDLGHLLADLPGQLLSSPLHHGCNDQRSRYCKMAHILVPWPWCHVL